MPSPSKAPYIIMAFLTPILAAISLVLGLAGGLSGAEINSYAKDCDAHLRCAPASENAIPTDWHLHGISNQTPTIPQNLPPDSILGIFHGADVSHTFFAPNSKTQTTRFRNYRIAVLSTRFLFQKMQQAQANLIIAPLPKRSIKEVFGDLGPAFDLQTELKKILAEHSQNEQMSLSEFHKTTKDLHKVNNLISDLIFESGKIVDGIETHETAKTVFQNTQIAYEIQKKITDSALSDLSTPPS